MSDTSILAEIERLRRLSVGELRVEWARLYDGEITRSRNKQFLFRRLCWRVQEARLGGLTSAAKERLAELAADITFTRAQTPKEFIRLTDIPPGTNKPTSTLHRKRDRRLPAVGTLIARDYKGRQLRLVVHDDHFEFDGQCFSSLSEAARHATGSRWDGFLFWGLKRRVRKA